VTTPAETDQPALNPEPFPPDWPPGDHPLEIAARRGLGPLSALGRNVWHGEALPCVSCGQLVRRGDIECDDCGQDLTPEMIDKMRAHAGPWYVLEHVRPFPGVTLERIVRQIRRGLLTETSIVRGPATEYQWRFAVETPGLCRYFGRCWQCHDEVGTSETYCKSCLSYLGFGRPKDPAASRPPARPEAAPTVEAPADEHVDHDANQARDVLNAPRVPRAPRIPPTVIPRGDSVRVLPAQLGTTILTSVLTQPDDEIVEPPPSPELEQLTQVMDRVPHRRREAEVEAAPTVFGIRATWIAALLLVLVVGGLALVTRWRATISKSLPQQTPVPTVSQAN
jgi:hypothetical protein